MAVGGSWGQLEVRYEESPSWLLCVPIGGIRVGGCQICYHDTFTPSLL